MANIPWITTPAGVIVPADKGNIKAANGRLRAMRVQYSGSNTVYFQLHDAVSTSAIGNTSLLGFGYELSPVRDVMTLDFEEELIFYNGISWAVSSTRNSYTSSAEVMGVFYTYY